MTTDRDTEITTLKAEVETLKVTRTDLRAQLAERTAQVAMLREALRLADGSHQHASDCTVTGGGYDTGDACVMCNADLTRLRKVRTALRATSATVTEYRAAQAAPYLARIERLVGALLNARDLVQTVSAETHPLALSIMNAALAAEAKETKPL